MRDNSFQTSKTTESSILKVERIKKVRMLLFTRDMEARTRDGRLSTLMRLKKMQPRE
jgi:hypothetical protein